MKGGRQIYDVVIVGAGGAGVTAAVAAAQAGAHVALISRDPVGYGDTRISDGIMARPGLVAGDDVDAFLADLLAGGGYLNQPDLAEIMAGECRQAAPIAEDFGVLFRVPVVARVPEELGKLDQKAKPAVGGQVSARGWVWPPTCQTAGGPS